MGIKAFFIFLVHAYDVVLDDFKPQCGAFAALKDIPADTLFNVERVSIHPT
jgi:hypothetical protein